MDRKMLVLIMLFIGISYAAENSLGGTGSVHAIINLYSGRTPPQWDLSGDEVSTLRGLLGGLPSAAAVKTPGWGYTYVKNSDPGSGLPYDKLYAFKKTVVLVDGSGVETYYRDTKGISEWLMARGDAHDSDYVRPRRYSLPEGTPSVAVIPSEISYAAGGIDAAFFTVFNEGNAALTGNIISPLFVISETESFNIPPGKGADFPLKFDTSKEGIREGYIEIRTNDPEKGSVKIPVKLSVLPQATSKDPVIKEGAVSSEAIGITQEAGESAGFKQSDQGLGMVYACAAVVAIIAVAGFLVYRHAGNQKIK
ncbi:MAG: hypothetical protein WAX07_00085 [Candidatus Altiarchaeia archaeon]